jgi:DNA-binding transcriptional MerR regulator
MPEFASIKAPDAFRTISEVADDLDLPQHVLRFWETRFNQIKPLKRGGGRRYYRPEDVDLLRGIRLLLYSEGFTIRGVQRLLKEKGIGFVAAVGQTGSVQTVTERQPEPAVTARPVREPPRLPEPPPAMEPAAFDEPLFEVPEPDQPAFETAEPQPQPVRPVPVQRIAALSRESRRKLEAALSELEEAQRLLEHAR